MNEGIPVRPEQTDQTSSDTYMMGRTEAETKRLIHQAGIFGPFTRRLLEEAGLKPGMRVLDVGSGAGDVALMVAQLVGPEGTVIGVDQNPRVLQKARARALEAGLANATFIEGDVRSVELEGGFDAAVGRLVLMYQPDPAGALRELTRKIRSGGIVAFQESNQTRRAVHFYPPTQLWERVGSWIPAVIERAGVVAEMGFRLFGTYLEAGLPAPRMELYSPIGGGPNWDGYEFVAETLRSLMPLVHKFGIATAEEVDVDTLAERLRAESIASGSVVKLPEMVSAWALKH